DKYTAILANLRRKRWYFIIFIMQIGKDSRVFVGIVVVCDKHKYCIPLSSPKDKHNRMKGSMDFSKIVVDGKLLGVLNFNLMIPVEEAQPQPIDIMIRKRDRAPISHYKEKCRKELIGAWMCIGAYMGYMVYKNLNKIYDEKGEWDIPGAIYESFKDMTVNAFKMIAGELFGNWMESKKFQTEAGKIVSDAAKEVFRKYRTLRPVEWDALGGKFVEEFVGGRRRQKPDLYGYLSDPFTAVYGCRSLLAVYDPL
ncbi:MAG: type III toxin-antitoxin system ToxN/AbiQ family toxin, partial [Lachnospiraceae bacterium]|nr:type III toxin-antitoxin system ToxN/AbiQ family toxin [Lachnospiraceae bacterium]